MKRGFKRSYLLPAVLLALAAPAPALAQSISINFGQNGSGIPSDTVEYGAIPVTGSNWNNFMGASGTASSVKDSSGASLTAAVTWTGGGDYQLGSPTNPVGYIFKGFMDDHRPNGAEASMTSVPYYIYDVILYPGSCDGGKKLHAPQINGKYYLGDGSKTIEGRAQWGSTNNTLASTTTLTEGVNYLRVNNLTGNLSVNGGGNNDNNSTGARGSLCAMQIVNAYDYDIYSRSATGAINWNTTDAVWTLNGTADQTWVNSTTENPTGMELTTTGATTVTVADGTVTNNIRLVSGTNALTFTGGSLSFLGAALVDLRAAGNGVSPNIATKITGTIPSGELVLYGIGDTSSGGGGNGNNTNLTNTQNDFIGNIRLKSGILQFKGAGLGAEGNKIIADGGGLVFTESANCTRALLVGLSGGLIRTYSGQTVTFSSISDEAAGSGGVLRHTDGGTLQLANNYNSFSGTFQQEAGNLYLGTGESAAPSVNGVFPSKINMTGGLTRLNYQGELTFASGALTGSGGTLEVWGTSGTKVNLNGQGTITLGALAIRTAEVNVGAGTTIDVNGQFRTGDYTSCPTVLNINGGTINANGTSNAVSNQASVLWGHWGSGATSTVNLSAGAFNSPSANVLLGLDSAATFNITGGTASVRGIDLNSANTSNSTLSVTGGTLNVGVGGIVNSNGTSKTVSFGAATIGAIADWSSTGPISLTDEATGTTFNPNGKTITLGGNVNGTGKLNVTGKGTLNIGAAAVLGDRVISVAEEAALSFSSTTANALNPAKTTIAGRLNVNDGANVGVSGDAPLPVGQYSVNSKNLFKADNGATMTVTGTDLANDATLNVSGGTLTLSSPLKETLGSSSMKLRLDASAISGVNSGDSITTWADTSGNGNNMINGETGIKYVASDAQTGLPAVSFPTNGESDMFFTNRISDIRSVFWVVNDGTTNNQSFLLGDSGAYHFHRNPNGALFDNNASDAIRSGSMTLNGEPASETSTLNKGNWDLLSIVTTGNVQANQLTRDREGYANRGWDGSIAEILIFNEALGSEQVRMVNSYLNDKWNLGKTGDYFMTGLYDFQAPNTSVLLTDNATIDASGFTTVELKDLIVASGKTATVVQDTGTVWKLANVEGTVTTQDDSALKVSGVTMEIAGAGTVGTAQFNSPLFSDKSTIDFDIMDTGFDVLTSTTTVDLTGATVEVNFDEGFTPELNDSFDIILSEAAGGIEGFGNAAFQFDTSAIKMIPDTFWFASLSADGKAVSVELGVPEPSSILLLFVGLTGLFWIRNRRR